MLTDRSDLVAQPADMLVKQLVLFLQVPNERAGAQYIKRNTWLAVFLQITCNKQPADVLIKQLVLLQGFPRGGEVRQAYVSRLISDRIPGGPMCWYAV